MNRDHAGRRSRKLPRYSEVTMPIVAANRKIRWPRKASRSGPRALAGKRPLTVIVDEKLIEDAKIAAIKDKTKVSAVVEDLLRGWLAIAGRAR